MSEIEEAFEDLLDAQEEACGERLKATVGTVAGKDAIVEETTFDEIIAAGGMAEAGGFRLQMRKSDFPARPTDLAAVTAKGLTLSLLTVVENNGVYIITAGDPAGEDEGD